MSNMPYDTSKLRNLIAIVPNNTGISAPGTAASDTVLLRIPVAADSVRLNRARFRLITGGTAAGPNVAIGKSLAGTGTVTQIGTLACGTDANGTVRSVSLTSTDFDDGDEIILTNLAGTAAASPAFVFSLGYREV